MLFAITRFLLYSLLISFCSYNIGLTDSRLRILRSYDLYTFEALRCHAVLEELKPINRIKGLNVKNSTEEQKRARVFTGTGQEFKKYK